MVMIMLLELGDVLTTVEDSTAVSRAEVAMLRKDYGIL